jgi:hypothetical protein
VPAAETPAAEAEPAPGGINGLWLILIGVVALLAILGGLFLYLGRPR